MWYLILYSLFFSFLATYYMQLAICTVIYLVIIENFDILV